MSGTNDAKRRLRAAMRLRRRRAATDPRRSAAIVDRLARMPCWSGARTVMVFEAVPGEPDLRRFVADLRERGIDVRVPEPRPSAALPLAPGAIDVVVVPGVAFARDGRRLGQGGGWYDRLLAGVRPDTVTIGVCFDEQLVDDLPTDPHDVRVGWVVTPSATVAAGPS